MGTGTVTQQRLVHFTDGEPPDPGCENIGTQREPTAGSDV